MFVWFYYYLFQGKNASIYYRWKTIIEIRLLTI